MLRPWLVFLFLAASSLLPACETPLETCPVDVELTTGDLPCACGSADVTSVPGDQTCTCTGYGTLNCRAQDDDTGDW